MEVAADQDAAVQSAHRMGDDVDCARREGLRNRVRERACPLLAARERVHHGKRGRVPAGEMGLEPAEIVDPENALWHQKAAREHEIHEAPPQIIYGLLCLAGTTARSKQDATAKPIYLVGKSRGGLHLADPPTGCHPPSLELPADAPRGALVSILQHPCADRLDAVLAGLPPESWSHYGRASDSKQHGTC